MVAQRPYYAEDRTARVLVFVAAVAVVAIDAVYLTLIRSQGGPPPDTPLVTPFVAGYLGLLAVALAGSLLAPPVLKAGLRGAAAAGLVVMGVLSAFSIGMGVLLAAAVAIAAVVLTIAARPGRRFVASAIVGSVIAVAVLFAGFQLSWSYVSCPASGESGGGIPSFIGSGGSYECRDGVLTVTR